MEQILIRNPPTGARAALKARAERHRWSVESDAREILSDALRREPATLVDLLGTDGGAEVNFEPGRLGSSRLHPCFLIWPVQYVLDTNVISALRVCGRNPQVETGVSAVADQFVTATTIAALGRGVVPKERADPAHGETLRRWSKPASCPAFAPRHTGAGPLSPIDAKQAKVAGMGPGVAWTE